MSGSRAENGPEAELRVERRGLLVDGLHDDGAGADHTGSGEAAPCRIDKEVGAEASAPVVLIDRELSEQDDRDRVRHAAADPGRHPAPLHRAGGEAVEPGHAVAVAGDIGARPAFGFVQPRLAPEPGVEGRGARGELRDVVAGAKRLRRA